MVWPTMSGMIVERRDHVLMTRFSFFEFRSSTFRSRCSSTNGPFFRLRGIPYLRDPRVRRRRMMSFWDGLFLSRVRPSGWPHGETGWRPPDDLPSPPPSGWSTGFMATPRVWGRTPRQRLRPALPSETSSASALPTSPTVARQSMVTRRISVLGRRSVAKYPSLATSCTLAPAPRASLQPAPGLRRVISEKSATDWNRRPALVGLRLRRGTASASLEELDAVVACEGDDRALGVGTGSEGERATVALALALAVERVHLAHADVEDRLDRLADLGLVDVGGHEERVDAVVEQGVGLLRHDRPDDHGARVLHSAGSSAAAAPGRLPRVNTTQSLH